MSDLKVTDGRRGMLLAMIRQYGRAALLRYVATLPIDGNTNPLPGYHVKDSCPISDLFGGERIPKFHHRIKNLIECEDIKTVGALRDYVRTGKIRRFPGFGNSSVAFVQQRLEAFYG